MDHDKTEARTGSILKPVMVCLVGTLAGLGLGLLVNPRVNNTKHYPSSNGRPALIRLERTGADQILVQRPDGSYGSLIEYLNRFHDARTQKYEDTIIKTMVGW